MSGEQVVIEELQTTAEQDEQAEHEAFVASLGNEVRAESAPTDEPATADKVIDAPAAAEVPPEQQAGLSTEEITAMLAKVPRIEALETMTNAELRKVHGKLGEFNQVLQELKKAGADNKSEVKLAGLNLKRLQAEYPDLAALLTDDLNDSIGTAKEQAPQVNFDERVAQVRDDLSKEMQVNLLRIQHRDYNAVTQSNDFKVWAQTLPEQDQVQLNDSWDAVYLGEKITDFKEWFGKKETSTNDRKLRLQRAIIPIGTQKAVAPQSMTEEDGFRAALGIR